MDANHTINEAAVGIHYEHGNLASDGHPGQHGLPGLVDYNAPINPRIRPGHIVAIVGGMFSNKTSLLLDYLRTAQQQGIPYIAFRPLDDRERYPFLTDHNFSQKFDATFIDNPADMIDLSKGKMFVGIEEICIFDTRVHDVVKTLRDKGHSIAFTTLSHYATGGPFALKQADQSTPPYTAVDVIQLADEVIPRYGRCAFPVGNNLYCGKPSTQSEWLIDHKNDRSVGGGEKFFACCNEHWHQPLTVANREQIVRRANILKALQERRKVELNLGDDAR